MAGTLVAAAEARRIHTVLHHGERTGAVLSHL
jgi:hypothetical protein